MTELVLCLPLFLFLLSLVFFFGREMVRLQEATVMSRYESWRMAEHAPPPGPDAAALSANLDMNDAFLRGDADEVAFRRGDGFPSEGDDALIDAAAAISIPAADYVDELTRSLPRGSTARFTTTYAEANGLWRRLAGPIDARHTRMANDWRHVNGLHLGDLASGEEAWMPTGPRVSNLDALREAFFDDFSNRLEVYADQGNELAGVIRGFYLQQPGYAGPEVPLEWIDR